MTKRLLVLLGVLALLVGLAAGCSSDDDSSSGDDTTTTAADQADDGGSSDTADTTDTADDGSGDDSGSSSGSCSDLEDEPGFVRAFCDGSATVSYDIDGTTGELTGGDCEASGGYFVVNVGTVVGIDWEGPQPDYAGFNLPPEDGDFTDVSAALNVDGNSYILTGATGSHTADSGTVTGTDMTSGATITMDFTC